MNIDNKTMSKLQLKKKKKKPPITKNITYRLLLQQTCSTLSSSSRSGSAWATAVMTRRFNRTKHFDLAPPTIKPRRSNLARDPARITGLARIGRHGHAQRGEKATGTSLWRLIPEHDVVVVVAAMGKQNSEVEFRRVRKLGLGLGTLDFALLSCCFFLLLLLLVLFAESELTRSSQWDFVFYEEFCKSL